MMKHFCQVGSVWQGILLVLSLITVITLTGCCVLSFRHRYNTKKHFGMGTVLLLNAALYVLMQVDSSITGAEHILHLPYVLAFAATVVSLTLSVRSILRETKNRKTINNTSIKESFDNLSTGVCFFNEAGLPALCNRAMHRFSFAVSGKDVQFITDLGDLLNEDFEPIDGAVKDGKVFTVSDGRAWQLEKRTVTDETGGIYTQFVALDVTDLQRNRVELTEENNQLRHTQTELKRLSANVVTVTREEEILNTKMRVHDEMGRCLIEARKYLREGSSESIPENVISAWQRAVSMLKYNNETADEDMLSQVRKTCESVKLGFVQVGKLPKEESAAYLLTCAVRECVTNAVRYAGASELYADFTETETDATVVVYNDGKQPDSEIIEGGGLSTLRRRVERAGGSMTVQSRPRFQLTITVPKGKEGVL